MVGLGFFVRMYVRVWFEMVLIWFVYLFLCRAKRGFVVSINFQQARSLSDALAKAKP